jgi:hypothetical protein
MRLRLGIAATAALSCLLVEVGSAAAVTPGWECVPATAGKAVVSGGAGATPSCVTGTTAVLAPTYVSSGVGAKPTVQFASVNVQIVNGSGSTSTINGRGNLVVGYDENPSGRAQTGSHDLVLGERNAWSGYSELLAGYANAASGPYSSVLGASNSASGTYAAVTGGEGNAAKGTGGTVGGGLHNTASSSFTNVTGGCSNLAGAGTVSVNATCANASARVNWFGSVSGGVGNQASALGSTVSGGQTNLASGVGASASGGEKNTASGTSASVSGGAENAATDAWGSILGGCSNLTGPDTGAGFLDCSWENANGSVGNTVSGGQDNWASSQGTNAAILGGCGNDNETFLFGEAACASTGHEAILGGEFNVADGQKSPAPTVGGGDFNSASGADASISGGHGGSAIGAGSAISGGFDNNANGKRSSVSGGGGNTAQGEESSILGGANVTGSTAHSCTDSQDGYFPACT